MKYRFCDELNHYHQVKNTITQARGSPLHATRVMRTHEDTDWTGVGLDIMMDDPMMRI